MELLKFLTCGSVDDGKSTLIGHMLYSAKLIFADQLQTLELDSKIGSADGMTDYSLLLDGLEAEREQGITIDVAYRFFSTEKRRFIVADTPGHIEYTRNMAVGASFAKLSLILVDVTKGVLVQTRRHCRICALMGIRDFVFAVNKMDLVSYDQEQFEKTEVQIKTMLNDISGEMDISVHSVYIIPVSATKGDNVTEHSYRTPWYAGMPLLSYLETVDTYGGVENEEFCMPVQRVSRPNASFRGYQGEIQSGCIHCGETIVALPSGEEAIVSAIVSAGEYVQDSACGEAVTLCFDREIDVSRGCVIASGSKDLFVGSAFAAEILWMNDSVLNERDRYRIQIGTAKVSCAITDIKYGIEVNTGEHINIRQMKKNELAVCGVHTDIPIVFDTFSGTQCLGELILIDPVTNSTAACGIVLRSIGSEGKPLSQKLNITREMREEQNGYKAKTVWFTGLSGSGKTTIANLLEKALFERGVHTMILDGDNVRMGLCKDLGFSQEGRTENIRRVAEAAKLMNDAGNVVLCSLISPLEADRKMARSIIGSDNFIEVFVNASLDTCIDRDVKGLYRKALLGEIREFTGISSAYENPLDADIVVDTEQLSAEEGNSEVFSYVWKALHSRNNYE